MSFLKQNMGKLDRSIRSIVGITLLILGPATDIIQLTTTSEILFAVIGSAGLLSGLLGYCMFYEFTDSNTMKKSS